MRRSTIHDQQGSLLVDFPETEPVIDEVQPDAPLEGTGVEIEARALHLYRTLGHFAYLSKTAAYETIDHNTWFQTKVARQHPHDYQQHLDDVLETRIRRQSAAETDFGEAFGINALIEDGSMTLEEAQQMAKDFFQGTNHSGANPDKQSFQRTYADSKNNKKLNTFRKVLEKQNPRLKK